MPRSKPAPLIELADTGAALRFLLDEVEHVPMQTALRRTVIPDLEAMRGKSVLLATKRQLPTVLTLIALDGIAARLFLATPDIASQRVVVRPDLIDLVITDAESDVSAPGLPIIRVLNSADSVPVAEETNRSMATEWILFTSGTTGQPKMVVHTLGSLADPLDDGLNVSSGAVWSTFYDIRRYGGVQILLRALLGGGSMVLSSQDETTDDFLVRCRDAGVTHISGTPSHWRNTLMSPAAEVLSAGYIRLSGEVVDQSLLDALVVKYPASSVAHAYATTEAGVGFDVRDGKAGFPAAFVDNPTIKAELQVMDSTLRIRSSRTSSGYIGQEQPWDDGFVDTGDLVKREGDRYYFRGRREGVINVGGQKVYPEEVEAILNAHPAVRMARAWGRTNAMTGQVVAADLILNAGFVVAEVRRDVLKHCRNRLEAWKIPVTLRQVDTIALNSAGKVARG